MFCESPFPAFFSAPLLRAPRAFSTDTLTALRARSSCLGNLDLERGRVVNTEYARGPALQMLDLSNPGAYRQSKAACTCTLSLLANEPEQLTVTEGELAQSLQQLKRGGGARTRGGAFTRAPSVSFTPFTAPRSSAAAWGLFVYKRITSAPPSLPGLWARPLALFPPPPTPNLLASQWCDLRIGWSRLLRSSYALPFRGAIKSAARYLLLFAPWSWKCNCWELRRLRNWRRRRLGRSERCDQAAIARLFFSPAASCLESNFFTIKKGGKKVAVHSSRPLFLSAL